MKTSIQIFLILLIFNACTSQVFKQNIEIEKTSNEFISSVNSIVIDKMNEYDIPGLSIGLVKNDALLYSKGFGVKSIKNGGRVTEHTIFHTASISKLFTAVAIMDLVEQNKISIDSKLVDILPNLQYDDERIKAIKIENLLNHTSGLPDIRNYHWKNNHQSDHSLENFVVKLNLKLDHDPASKYQYSNLAYDILGYVIEKVSGVGYDDYMKENILNKNKMYSSDFRYFKIIDSLTVSPHSKKFLTKKIYEKKTYPYTREHAPSSTLNASSKELSNWMSSFLQSVRDADTNKAYLDMIQPTFNPYPYIGYGFQLSKINGNKTIEHYGGDRGFRSYLMMIPEKKIGLVLLANCDYKEDFRQEILHSIAKLMLELDD